MCVGLESPPVVGIDLITWSYPVLVSVCLGGRGAREEEVCVSAWSLHQW